jgi:hypothetical protein
VSATTPVVAAGLFCHVMPISVHALLVPRSCGPSTVSFSVERRRSFALVTLPVTPPAAISSHPRAPSNPRTRPQPPPPVVNDAFSRRRGATPTRFSLVPAYAECAAPNRVHGPPLEHPACNPPARESSALTIGSPDANGLPASSQGSAVLGVVVGNPATLVTLGDLHNPHVVLAIIGFFAIVTLDYLRVRGAILIGIVGVTVLSFFFGGNQFHGIVSAPPSISPTLFQLDIRGALSTGVLNVILVFFLVELFDATGTLMGVANRAGLLVEGKMHRLNRALLADSTAILAGSMLGTSSTTAYIESASGVQAGGRTGVTAVTVAVLFLAALFFAPLAGVVPGYATAPALLYVSCLMLREMLDLPWDDATEVVPAALTALLMPFTYSIANGVAFGFISYAGLKLLTGRARQVKLVVWIIAAIFLFRYFYLGSE